MPTLSIVIPVYNVEKYLQKCLDSILVDNSFTGQVVCVNDGSTDGSGKILEEYATKFSNIEIVNQKNAGLSAARNAGFERATGDYVFFQDSDDWIFPGSIEKIMSKIDGEEVVYFNARVYYEENQSFGGDIAIPNIKNMDGQAYFAAIYDKPRNMPCVCVCGGIYLRSFMIDNNLYNEPGIYHEDNYFTPQLLLAAKHVSSINEYVYAYRIRSGSITAHVTEKHIKDLLFIARNLYAKYEQIDDILPVFFEDVCGIYSNMIISASLNNISFNGLWRKSDSKIMQKCAKDARHRKIAKLTYLSPEIAYKYMTDNLPSFWRRLINRFL